MMKTSRSFSVCVLVLASATLMLMGGCNKITASSVRTNMSPEMDSIAHTHQQRLNRLARSENTSFRQVLDDWDTFWLMDEPSRLSMYPIP